MSRMRKTYPFTPRLDATRATPIPSSGTSRTASALNSDPCAGGGLGPQGRRGGAGGDARGDDGRLDGRRTRAPAQGERCPSRPEGIRTKKRSQNLAPTGRLTSRLSPSNPENQENPPNLTILTGLRVTGRDGRMRVELGGWTRRGPGRKTDRPRTERVAVLLTPEERDRVDARGGRLVGLTSFGR